MTWYSGRKDATIILIATLGGMFVLGTVYTDQVRVFLLESHIFGPVAGILITIAIALIVHQFFHGLYSITLTPDTLHVRSYGLVRHIDLRSTENALLYTSNGGLFDRMRHLWLYAKHHSSGDTEVYGIRLSTFSEHNVTTFLTQLVEGHPGLCVNPKLRKIVERTTKHSCTNPESTITKTPRPQGFFDVLGLTSTFSEATLFLMSMSFIMLCLLEYDVVIIDLQKILSVFLNSEKGGGILILIPMMIIGLMASIYHLFKRGKKSVFARSNMIMFAIGMSAGTGILGGLHTWSHEAGLWEYVISAWSVTYSILLLVSMNDKDDAKRVQSGDAKLIEVLIGMIVVSLIIFTESILHNTYWAITFGLCIAYASLINNRLYCIFPELYARSPVMGIRMPVLDLTAGQMKIMSRVIILLSIIMMMIVLSYVIQVN